MKTKTQALLPRILLVDDDPLLREGIELSLRGLCEVIGLSSGDELEDILESVEPELLILDVVLPGRDGFDLCGQVRSRPGLRSLPVIFLTGLKGEGAFERCLAVQGDAFLGKPFSRDELVETVVRLLPAEEPKNPPER